MSPSPDGPFDDPQQVITDLRRQLAERTTERDDALAARDEDREQLTATAEVLGVINSSRGDLAPVFDSILEKALRLCEASFGSFHTFDGDAFRVEAQRGFPATLTQNMRSRRLRRPPEGSLLHRLVYGEDLVQVEDLSASTLPSSLGGRKALIEAGARTMLWIALRKDSVLFGAINIYRQEVSPFSDKQIALLRNFAAQAVIAMENARLLSELRGRTRDLQESLEYQTAISDVLSLISRSTFDLHPVLDTLVNTAGRLCNADHGMLTLRDGEAYRVATTFAFSDEWDAFIRRQTFAAGRGSVIGRTLLEARVVQIADIAVDPEYQLPEAVTVGKFRTVLGVPLLREGEPVEVFAFGRDSVDPFTENQIELVRTFADQAVIAMENARLITETREALDQQTATAEVLGVINSSPGDLAPVFDAMLEKAMRLCEADFGSLGTYDGLKMHLAASRGFSSEAIEAFREFVPPVGAMSHEIVQGARIVHVADVLASEAYQAGVSSVVTLVDTTNIRTGLWVALRKDDDLLGMLQLYRTKVERFSDKQIALVGTFADQAVIAIENARLLGELRARTEEVAELNRGLEARVADQVEELGRVGRLKQFLAPQLAELIVSQGDEKILESHRREIVVVFCDLRGYTAFTETAEPEEVLDFLREYHGALGPLVSQFEGTLDQFSGDGIMVFFNDPVPCPNPAERAVKMAAAMREVAGTLIATWRRRDRELGFGVGIAQGYATLGQIGFAERSGYTAIGTVCNLAARLCAEAKSGQILISGRVAAAVEAVVPLEDLGSVPLKVSASRSRPSMCRSRPANQLSELSKAARKVPKGGAA